MYHATKWAVEGWSESLSFELAAHDIQVKTISAFYEQVAGSWQA
ncbi:hypothetical protein [Chryseobacterium sp. PCH239]|nr:hypothetical protein [Chryseobacterium sp. PCH239]